MGGLSFSEQEQRMDLGEGGVREKVGRGNGRKRGRANCDLEVK